ncbi:MAG: shikimate dehydrogenase, partial [Chloroflexota bacterium]
MSASLGIIGFPIAHSISPAFQQAALDYCGIDATYQAW